MSALAGQQWPAAARPAVERLPVSVLAVAVLVIAMPDRTAGRVDPQQAVDDLQTVADMRVVCAPEALAHELEEVGRDLSIGRQIGIGLEILDRHQFRQGLADGLKAPTGKVRM